MPRGRSDVVCPHHPVNRQVEEQRADIGHPCLTPVFTPKRFAVSHSALEVVSEALNDKDDLLWNSICPEYAP